MDQPPIDLVSHVSRHNTELTAIRYWLRTLYRIACARAPADYATVVRSEITEAKNSAPPPDTSMSSEDQEAMLAAMIKPIEELGAVILQDLTDLAADMRQPRLCDQKQARQAGGG